MRFWRVLALVGGCALGACVNVDPETGKTIPRGDQKFEFEYVRKQAEKLELGMTTTEVLILLGSPAERDVGGTEWVYLPERPAVLIPGKALRLVFENGRLKKYAYHPIILGQEL